MTEVSPPAADVRLLSQLDVIDTLRMSRTEIWTRLNGNHRTDPDPNFPKPFHVGRMLRWRSDEIQAFIEHLSNARQS